MMFILSSSLLSTRKAPRRPRPFPPKQIISLMNNARYLLTMRPVRWRNLQLFTLLLAHFDDEPTKMKG
jgi:hypothetical protein